MGGERKRKFAIDFECSVCYLFELFVCLLVCC